MKFRAKRRTSLILASVLTGALCISTSIVTYGAEDDIVILYTNDVHCGVDDVIGYAGLSLYEKQMKQETPYVTLVDTGDAIQGASIGTLSEGEYLIDIMNQVGYDVAVPGNHEFDYGMERFLDLAKRLDCGYYSCNFLDLRTGETVFEPYRMVTYGDTDIAYVGVTTPESFTKSTPAFFQDENGNYIYTFCEDLDGQRLYQQVQQAVDAARSAGAEYVILTAHLGENYVTEIWNAPSVLANTRGIDICIDGHSHETTPSMTVKNLDGQDVLITQTGTKLNQFGQLTIRTDGTFDVRLVDQVPAADVEKDYVVKKGDNLSRIASRELGSSNLWKEIYRRNRAVIKNADLLPIGLHLILPGGCITDEKGRAMDASTDRFIKQIQSQYQETLKTVLGRTDYELTDSNPADGMRRVRNGETNLGDLTADAYRFQLGAEIGFSNGGGIRASIKPGNITYNETLAVFPFGNMGCVIEATGQQIKDALEMGARNYPEESGAFIHVSGMTYTIDSSVKSSVRLDEKRNFVRVDGEYRVKDIMVGGEPLELNRTYTVASHNYWLKSGGDGMSMFNGSKLLKDEAMVDVDILSGYIHTMGGAVSDDYADPLGQGRITIR